MGRKLQPATISMQQYNSFFMNGYKNSTELKANARGYLINNYGRVVPVQLMYLLFVYMVDGLSGGLLTSGQFTFLRSALAFGLAFISAVLGEILKFGLCRFYMNLCCNFPANVSDLFRGFRFADDRPARIAVILISRMVFYLCPAFAVFALYAITNNHFLLPIGSLIGVVGFIFYYIFRLQLSQCYYLILDFPEKSADEIVGLSKWLMQGQKLRLFYLQVSFIPILLLSLIPCGLGLLWSMPYANASFACFHLNLTAQAAQSA